VIGWGADTSSDTLRGSARDVRLAAVGTRRSNDPCGRRRHRRYAVPCVARLLSRELGRSASAAQGALARSVLVTQGQITEAGYTEQANNYAVMSSTARATAAGELTIAAIVAIVAITSAIIALLFTVSVARAAATAASLASGAISSCSALEASLRRSNHAPANAFWPPK